ncbi:phage tail protein [Cognatazoarcus halotolerans]|uniref:phage tail protein n=1 Tax=Cognatazoarcus halotolerans TaxID=2686016 RepID=UPI00135CEB2C|nr:phage tail protein [Cognatazoarcus halotolerans]MCP5310781.1 phage tail protein [Zoogloeaceae bacterium]MCP5466008.1 phage tail protein [Nevskiaceae bacterium]
MDANGQRFWLLADDAHWPGRAHVEYRAGCRALRLASERTLSAPPADAAAIAASALERLPRAVDRQGATARWDEAQMAIVVTSHLPEPAILLPLAERPLDFAAGFDDVLYVALAERLLLHDLRGRWPDTVLPTPGFQAWRIAADPAGGAWLLERASGRLGRLSGCVQPARPAADYAHTTFRPAPENPTPPTLRLFDGVSWPAGERPQSLALASDGTLALLSWFGDGESRLRLFDRRLGRLGAVQTLDGALFAYSIDWLSEGRIAARLPGRRDAPVWVPRLAPAAALTLRPAGDIYPLAAEAEEAPFAHRLDDPPCYPLAGGSVEPLYRLSVSNLARRGEAANFSGGTIHLIDSGDQQTIWHRLYAEARLPAGCGMLVWLATSAEPSQAGVLEWHAHQFGELPADARPFGAVPRAAWERQPSELPGHPGLGAWGAPEAGRAGLWSALIQRAAHRVRALSGRYLWVRVSFFGDGRDSPELAALRAWGSRFSYRDQYLPRLYRETEYGAAAESPGVKVAALDALLAAELDATSVPDALRSTLSLGDSASVTVLAAGSLWQLRDGAAGWILRLEAGAISVYRPQATPADFLERLLGNVEGVLTPLEDRAAAAHLASDPVVAPQESLDWLGGWLGVAFDAALPEARRREWLARSSELARYHGTSRGLRLALDIATDGGVRGGEIVLLEGFRMRRLMSTLLGVNLNVEDDPLLPGLIISGNSVVGDTLILGEAERVELLALFRDELVSSAEHDAVLAFYDKLAFRAMVLVHQSVEPQDLGLIRRIVELESPAHVEVQVETATWPLLVGIASLVGVDTWLGPPRERTPARADVSSLGNGDYVLGVGSLDPRLSGATTPLLSVPAGAPVADAGPDMTVPHGRSFVLDGGGSIAPPGGRITEYRWRLVD